MSIVMAVFVLDRNKKPLMPCSEKRARLLLARGRAVVHIIAPFTIGLKDRTVTESVLQPLRVKLDPGSKTTGVAMAREGTHGTQAIFFGEIVHKTIIKKRLHDRQGHRLSRRFRHTRYRKPRFQNRQRQAGWLPPSLAARVDQTLHALAQLRQRAPVTDLSVEHVRFDTQKMQNPEISGVAYQQGTLLGYEIREYVLDKWNRRCAYCDIPQADFQLDHVVAQSRGGSDRVSNLALACPDCNQSKDNRRLEDFLAQDPGRRRRATRYAPSAAWEAIRLERIQQQLKTPLKDAAMMNATRWRLYTQLQATGLPVEGGSGGRTKKQRIAHHLPKGHYYDALCVCESTPDHFTTMPAYVQIWTAKGRGHRQMCRTDKYGFPIRHLSRQKRHFGFQTGDLVHAIIPRGKYTGTWTGRATVKASGQIFIVTTSHGIHPTTSYRYCRVLQRGNGWTYRQKPANPERREAASSPASVSAAEL
jgi:5-methylcytosine-specific restriction endonuclease McrA